jgi:hypothetical protein
VHDQDHGVVALQIAVDDRERHGVCCTPADFRSHPVDSRGAEDTEGDGVSSDLRAEEHIPMSSPLPVLR